MKLFFKSLRTTITLLVATLLIASHNTQTMPRLTTICSANLSNVKKSSLNPIGRYPLHIPKHYNRFIAQPLLKKMMHHDQLAPDNVQQLSNDFALAMLEHDKLFFRYLKTCGYLSVYEGADKKMPYFFEKTGCDAYCNFYGGIHFPKNSFTIGISALQRFIIGHELGHITNNDLTNLTIQLYNEGDEHWYQTEYQAQKSCTQVLYERFKDYEALESRLESERMWHNGKKNPTKTMLELSPLCTGLCGTLHKLNATYHDDKRLRNLCAQATEISPSSIKFSKEPCDKLYRQFMAPYMIYQARRMS